MNTKIVVKKKKKPSFLRTDAHKMKRLRKKWTRPKGIQNKRRLHKRGYAPVISPGYGTDNKTKGQRAGLNIVLIKSVAQVDLVDKKTQGIIISSKLGSKNKLVVLEKASKLGITVFNFNVDKKIADIKMSVEDRKKNREDRKQKKEKKSKEEKKEKKEKKEKDSKKEEEVSTEEPSSDEDKKEKEKKELDKILTKK